MRLVNLTPHPIVLRNIRTVSQCVGCRTALDPASGNCCQMCGAPASEAIDSQCVDPDVILPSEGIARVETFGGNMDRTMDGVPVPIYHAQEHGPVTGLPPCPRMDDGRTICSRYDPWTMYIVSLVVARHPDVVGRYDVVCPGTGPNDGAIRDEQGRIVAVTRLIRA
jgi:hypothetical protein